MRAVAALLLCLGVACLPSSFASAVSSASLYGQHVEHTCLEASQVLGLCRGALSSGDRLLQCCTPFKALKQLGCFCDEEGGQQARAAVTREAASLLLTCDWQDADFSLSTRCDQPLEGENLLDLVLLAGENDDAFAAIANAGTDAQPLVAEDMDVSIDADTLDLPVAAESSTLAGHGRNFQGQPAGTPVRYSTDNSLARAYAFQMEQDADLGVDIDLPQDGSDVTITVTDANSEQDMDFDVDIFLPHAESDVVITVRDDSDGVTIASRDITLDVAVPDGAVVKVDSGSSDVTVSITTSEKAAGARSEGGMSVTYDSEDSAGLTVDIEMDLEGMADNGADLVVEVELDFEAGESRRSAGLPYDLDGQDVGSVLLQVSEWVASMLPATSAPDRLAADVTAPQQVSQVLEGISALISEVGEQVTVALQNRKVEAGGSYRFQVQEDGQQFAVLKSAAAQNLDVEIEAEVYQSGPGGVQSQVKELKASRRHDGVPSDLLPSAVAVSKADGPDSSQGHAACRVCQWVDAHRGMLWALVALNVAFVGILLAASGARHFFRCTDRAILEVMQDDDVKAPLIVNAAEFATADDRPQFMIAPPIWEPAHKVVL